MCRRPCGALHLRTGPLRRQNVHPKTGTLPRPFYIQEDELRQTKNMSTSNQKTLTPDDKTATFLDTSETVPGAESPSTGASRIHPPKLRPGRPVAVRILHVGGWSNPGLQSRTSLLEAYLLRERKNVGGKWPVPAGTVLLNARRRDFAEHFCPPACWFRICWA